MNEFEKVLQECLLALEAGDSTPDECLSRHPNYAPQLEPILLTTFDLLRGRDVHPSAALKSRVRARLTEEMRTHPRRSVRFNFLFMRTAVGFAVVLLALLVTGTVYAQGSLPGEAFYSWKLASENVWRMVYPDRVGTDLAIADRRADELIAIGKDSEQHTQTVGAYLDVVARLEVELDEGNEARIRPVLESQMEELNEVGITFPHEDQPPVPASTPEKPSETTHPTPVVPDMRPTAPIHPVVPKIEPTIEIPPPIH